MIKDSGTRREFETGSVRDAQEGKGRFDLIPYLPHKNLAKHYEAGIKKYGERNWEKGQPLQVFLDSANRHILRFMNGERDEDHLSASVWNAYGYQWTENEIIEGRLPYSLTKDLNPTLLKYIDDKIADKKVKEFEISGTKILKEWEILFGGVEYREPKHFGFIRVD
jgi:hypothetical protein